MAKKKEEDKDEEGFDDLEELEDQEIEIVYPKIEKGKKKDKVDDLEAVDDLMEGEEEDVEFEEEEEEVPEYKYLDLQIIKKEGENNYEILVDGQSHGFLNVFVKHLLALEGVDIAAYKKNNVESPKIFIKLKKGFKIKEILRTGISNLRNEVIQVQKIFKNLT